MHHTFKISLKGHLKIATASLVYFGAFVIFALTLFILMPDHLWFIMKAGLAAILLPTGPAIFLHMSYYWHNKDWIISDYENRVEIRIGNSVIVLDRETVVDLTIYMAPTYIEYNTTSGLPTEEYNYIEIHTKSGTYIITNLLYPDIKKLAAKIFKGKPKYHKTLFADF